MTLHAVIYRYADEPRGSSTSTARDTWITCARCFEAGIGS